jgi:hypothetical protein
LTDRLGLFLPCLAAWRICECLCAFGCGLLDCTHGLWCSKLATKYLTCQTSYGSTNGTNGSKGGTCAKSQSRFTCANELIDHTRLLWCWCVLLLKGCCVLTLFGKLVGLCNSIKVRRATLISVLNNPCCVFLSCCH